MSHCRGVVRQKAALWAVLDEGSRIHELHAQGRKTRPGFQPLREYRQHRLVGKELLWVGQTTCMRQLGPARLPNLDKGSGMDVGRGPSQGSSCAWYRSGGRCAVAQGSGRQSAGQPQELGLVQVFAAAVMLA